MAIKTLSNLGEFALIDLLKKNVKGSSKVIGIGDDTAVAPIDKDRKMLLTTDMIIERVHFTQQMKPQDIGHKAMAVNISDIAAMGGLPQFAVISIGLPSQLSVSFVEGIYAGANALAKKFNVSIVGGDTVRSQKVTISVTLVGEVDKKNLVLRKGAKVGDTIFVSGPLGNSFKTRHHLKFTPRIKESQFLVGKCKPSAMIDVSDGLTGDLAHILKASRHAAVLYEDQIPFRKGARLRQALYDGEDFELLFTLSPKNVKKLKRLKMPRGMRFYPVGTVTKGKPAEIHLIDRKGVEHLITGKGYTHF